MCAVFCIDDKVLSEIRGFRAGLCAANPALKGEAHNLVFDAIVDALCAQIGQPPVVAWRRAAVVAVGLIADYDLGSDVAEFFALIDFATGFEELL